MPKESSQPLNPGSPKAQPFILEMMSAGLLINIALGALVHALKLPFYFDSVGTIAVTLLLGIRVGVITGVFSILIGIVFISPMTPWFCGTAAAIAVYTGLVARFGGFRTLWRVVVSGLGLGIVAAVVSAPILVKFYGLNGNSTESLAAIIEVATNAISPKGFFSSAHTPCEPIDKIVQCVFAYLLLHSLPKPFLRRFVRTGYLAKNKL